MKSEKYFKKRYKKRLTKGIGYGKIGRLSQDGTRANGMFADAD